MARRESPGRARAGHAEYDDGGDSRPLLVGMEGLTVSIGAVPGWRPCRPDRSRLDVLDDVRIRVARTGGIRLRLAALVLGHRAASDIGHDRADFELSGDVLSFVRPNTIEVRIDGKATATWMVTDPAGEYQHGDTHPLSHGRGTHHVRRPRRPRQARHVAD